MSIEMVGARECLRAAGLPEPKEQIAKLLQIAGIEPDVIAKHGTKQKFYLTVEKSNQFIDAYKKHIEQPIKKEQDLAPRPFDRFDWENFDKEFERRKKWHDQFAQLWIDRVAPVPSWYIMRINYDSFLVERFEVGVCQYFGPSDYVVNAYLHTQDDADIIGEKYRIELLGKQDERGPMFVETGSIAYLRQVEP